MAKQGSNRNIYIFWGSIALIIVVVLLVIFLPRVNYSKPYSNLYEISQSVNKEDSHNKNMEFYATNFVNTSAFNPQNTQIQGLLNLQKSMACLNNFGLTSLQFLQNNDLKKLSDEQSNLCVNAQTKIDDLLDYCDSQIYGFFSTSTTPTTDIYNTYYSKYLAVVQSLVDFYVSTANLMQNCSLRCIEITDDNLETTQNYMTDIKTQAYSDSINSSSCYAILVRTNNYYNNFN